VKKIPWLGFCASKRFETIFLQIINAFGTKNRGSKPMGICSRFGDYSFIGWNSP
jgi:hypothetical protein